MATWDNYWGDFNPDVAGSDYWQNFQPETPDPAFGLLGPVTGKLRRPWEKGYHKMADLPGGLFDYTPVDLPEYTTPEWNPGAFPGAETGTTETGDTSTVANTWQKPEFFQGKKLTYDPKYAGFDDFTQYGIRMHQGGGRVDAQGNPIKEGWSDPGSWSSGLDRGIWGENAGNPWERDAKTDVKWTGLNNILTNLGNSIGTILNMTPAGMAIRGMNFLGNKTQDTNILPQINLGRD